MTVFRRGRLSGADIFSWLSALRAHAHIPESHYAVAAVARVRCGSSADYHFAGVNVENREHRLSLHAEEAALAAMHTGLGAGAAVEELWMFGGPMGPAADAAMPATVCGKCRQQISGFVHEDAQIHVFDRRGHCRSSGLNHLLPERFSLGLKERQSVFDAPSEDIVRRRLFGTPGWAAEDWLAELNSGERFSPQPQKALLHLTSGDSVAGVRLEDAAFLSLNAIQAALAVATTQWGPPSVAAVDLAGEAPTLAAVQMLRPFAARGDIPMRHDGRAETLDTLAARMVR